MKIERGNPSHSWSLWKKKFDIYLRATGSSTEPDEKKVGLHLNHIGEEGLDIYDTFTFLPARPNPIQGQPALPMEDPNHHETVLEKYADYFGRRDPQLMLREKFWFHLNREPSQTLEFWVLAIKKLAAECKFPATYMNQAVRDKLTFSWTDEAAKSKLYDVGSDLTLDRAIEILTTKYELQESKSAHIDEVKSKAKKKTSQGSQSKPAAKQYKSGTQGDKVECGYCGGNHPKGKKNCPAANHKCERCNIKGHFTKKCRTSPARVAQIAECDAKTTPKMKGRKYLLAALRAKYTKRRPISHLPKIMASSSLGWYIKLKTNFDLLPWYIDSGAEISVMPETLYKKSYGDIPTGENPLHTLGCVRMELSRGDTTIQEDVYIVQGVKTLLLGQPAIEKLGLIPNIPGATGFGPLIANKKKSQNWTRKTKSSKRIPNYSLDSVNLRASTLFDFETMQNHFASTLRAGCPCR